ncbi:MAG: DUF547 domain-containing protein [Acidobacteria bacterium]|nr:DUF547 domain-containing protein [Acidobacteriota bacterium]
MTRRIASALIAIALLAPSAATAQQSDMYATWERTLAEFVNDEGLVDYAGLKTRGLGDLQAFMDVLARTDPNTFATEAERMAFWINAYNAVVIWQVVERHPIDSVRDVGVLWGLVGGFFKQTYTVAGSDMSADNIEHDTLRAQFDDERIHWALVCAAFGCPRLLNVPYRAETLDQTLQAQSHEFLAQPRGMQLDRTSNTLYLSSYFDWYEDDFLQKADSRVDYALSYGPEDIATYVQANRDDITVRIMDYDWTLNEQSRGPRSRRPVPR